MEVLGRLGFLRMGMRMLQSLLGTCSVPTTAALVEVPHHGTE